MRCATKNARPRKRRAPRRASRSIPRLAATGTTNDLTATFAYNPASQITQTVRTGDTYAWTGHGTGSTSFTQNGLNQQVTIGGSAASWDSKGNLTSEPQSGKTYGYSSENLLTSASGSVTLSYDPSLRLYQVAGAATTRFAYDGVNAIAEYNGSNALQRRYVFGPGVDQPLVQYEGTGTTDRRFMGSDERGSIISLTDGSGAVLTINRYDEYGKPQSANAGRFQYTGQKWVTELGLYDYKARDYLSHLGIFAQTDPIDYEDSANLYAYVADDPVNWTDALGLGWPANPCPYMGGPGGGTVTCTAQNPNEPHDFGPGSGAFAGGGSSSGGPGDGSGGRAPGKPTKPTQPKKEPICKTILKYSNALENAGSKIQDFGSAATAAGLVGDLAALAFPPAEIGTGSLTAAGGFITAVGTGVSGAGAGLNFIGTHDVGRAALSVVGVFSGMLKSSGVAHNFLRGLNLGKAVDTAKALMPQKC